MSAEAFDIRAKGRDLREIPAHRGQNSASPHAGTPIQRLPGAVPGGFAKPSLLR
jgi:hypothetical protein